MSLTELPDSPTNQKYSRILINYFGQRPKRISNGVPDFGLMWDDWNEIDKKLEGIFSKLKQDIENCKTPESARNTYRDMGRLAFLGEYIPAMLWMGDFEENVLENLDEAVQWYKKASESGSGEGSRCYADMLMTGRGVQQDYNLAMHYYADAADKDVPEALFVLGEHFRKSEDYFHAYEAYYKSWKLGYEHAKTRIDQMIENNDAPKYMQYLTEIMPIAKEKEYIRDDNAFVFIPELLEDMGNITNEMYRHMMESKTISPFNKNKLALIWSFYAGFGATFLWNENWDKLKKDGILNSLVNPRGIENMDEYVTDISGLKFGSEESNSLIEFLKYIEMIIEKDIIESYTDEQTLINLTLDGCRAMYLLGLPMAKKIIDSRRPRFI